MTPYYAQPPQSAPAAYEPKTRLDIGLVAASPKGDWDQVQVETSPGFHLALGFAVGPSVSLFAGLRYIKVKPAENDSSFDGIDISHRELQLGLRFTSPMSPTAKFFLEGNVHAATISVDADGGEGESESGMGLGVRAGMMFMVDSRIGLGGAIAYSSAGINPDETDFEDAWLSGDAFVSFGF